MRHRVSQNKLGRSPSHRKAMIRNMARSLLTHESIRTTTARAKALSVVADNLVTLALKNDLHARRQAYKVVENHQLVKKLFDEIGPRFDGRNGGYTRIVKLADPRRGDSAQLAVIEFTVRASAEASVEEAPAEKPASKKPAAKKSASKAKTEETAGEEAKTEEPEAEESKGDEASAETPSEETDKGK